MRALGTLLATLCITLLLGTTVAAPPAQARAITYNLDIPSQSLNDALQALALASQHKLLYSSELVDGRTAPALQGEFTTEEAVQRLLTGTNLSFEVTSDGLVLIRSRDAATSILPAAAGSVRSADGRAPRGAGPTFMRLAQSSASASQPDSTAVRNGPESIRNDPPSPASEGAQNIQELVVTGSRIPQRNLTSTSPITVIGDQEVQLQGTTNAETLINNLPAAFADFTSSVTNGATGTATVNLRGLGAARTLVLIDGKRLMPGDPGYPYADLNAIPAALIDHVEVVTGGASAVYGSDALAGVINFVMKRDFEGVRFDAQYGFFQHDQHQDGVQEALNIKGLPIPGDFTGGGTISATALIGINSADGKGNATLYAGYRHMDAVTEDKLDYSACSLSSTPNDAGVYDHRICFGSRSYNRITSADLLAAGAPVNTFYAETDRTFTPYAGQNFNFAPYNFLQRPDDRYTLGGFAHYEVSPMFDVYTDVMFSDDHTFAQIAPSGLIAGVSANPDGVVTVNCDNPLMSAQQAAAIGCGTLLGSTDDASLLIARRNVEGGGRLDDLRHTSYRIDLGTRGELGSAWSYDVYGQYGRTNYSETFSNDISIRRVQNALEVVRDPRPGSATFGQPVCKVVLAGIDGSCVPFDLFGGFGAITPEQLDYVEAEGFKTGYTEEEVVSASLTGDLGQYGVKLPTAHDGIGVAIGAEYRLEALRLNTSREFRTNDLYGQGSATLPVPRSSFDVKEFYGEARIPLVQDARFAQLLQLEAGFRLSDYSSVGSTNAWKLGLDWQPISDVRFRASYQRAVRAPNVLESFAPNDNVLFSFADPCAGPTPTSSFAECQRTGVTAAQYGHIIDCPAGLCREVVGGNPDLTPESSSTKSFGLVLTPGALQGFSASIDYFDIKVNDQIRVLTGEFIFDRCIADGTPYYCNLVNRDTNGTLFTEGARLINVSQNTGFLRTQGIDFEVNYKTTFADLGMGNLGGLSFNLVSTRLDSLEFQSLPEGGPSYECAGLYGPICLAPAPTWRTKARVTWTSPWNIVMSLNWRHLSAVKLDLLDPDPQLNGGIEDTVDAKMKAQDYVDLAATWTLRQRITLRLGINNVFDRNPPVVDSSGLFISDPRSLGNANTFPGTYDALGRTIFMGVTADL